MKRFFLILQWILPCLIIAGIYESATARNLPVINGEKTVALVNDEPITLDELNQAIAAAHEGMIGQHKVGHINFSPIIHRLINIRLILLEARNMGLDELPEVKTLVEKYSEKTMMELLLEQHVKDIAVDKDEIEKVYKEQVKEFKIKQITFKNEKDAKKIKARIKTVKDFDAVVKKAVSEKIPESVKEEYLKNKDLRPRVAQLISTMKIGAVSPVVFFGKNAFMIFKLEGIRYPKKEDPKERKTAMHLALIRKKQQSAKDYYNRLRKKYVTENQKVLDALDYESKTPGFETLMKDDRIIAKIMGETPITVGDLSKALKKRFFHGIKQAIESKSVNRRKKEVYERMLEERVLDKEASIQGLDKTEAFKTRVKDYKNSVIFGEFINKAVIPQIELTQKEIKAYYDKNRQTYTTPKMMRIKSLVFKKREDAVNALNDLTKGTDFGWMSAHANGQADKAEKGIINFEGRMLILSSLPKGVQKAVSNVKPGDYRLYESPDNYFYVLYIYHVVVPEVQPFKDVRAEIAKKVFNDKIKETVEDYANKLRKYYPVKIYRKDLMK